MKVLYLTSWVGDYHAPRLIAAQKILSSINIDFYVYQFGSKSNFYFHKQSRRNSLIEKINFTQYDKIESFSSFVNIFRILNNLQPDCIFSLGYNDKLSLASMFWAKFHKKKIYFMSDSKADDQPRGFLTEVIKSFVIKPYDGALVAGERHKRYFQSLGFKYPICIGYDVVDNLFFSNQSRRYQKLINRKKICRYVLCVSRLVERKKVNIAIDIFYKSGLASEGYSFLLIGDGPLKESIIEQLNNIIPDNFIYFPSIPNHRMPFYYAFAKFLILTSEYDQWGLCVNEAMACGVPALVTQRCGVADELVTDDCGIIWREDDSIENIAYKLRSYCTDDVLYSQLVKNVRRKIGEWGVDIFAKSLVNLVIGNVEGH